MLEGLRVIEFEGLGPGPFAAMLLADLGAEVITIHRPGPGAPGLLDRGKRSITLDLKAPDDIAIARALIASAEALIEGLRPGVMERLGLGPKDCHALNSALVYARMTGWGQTGPLAPVAGHDLNYLARSGALWFAGLPGDAPMPPPALVGDIGGGAMYLAVGLLAGVMRARMTGQGTTVDAAIVDGSAHMLALLLSLRPPTAQGFARGTGPLDGPHWSRSYGTADGGHVAVQAYEPKFYALLLEGLGLAGDPAMAAQHDPEQWPAQTARLAAIFAAHPRAHWETLFGASDACVAPVLSPDEAAADPHMAERGTWQETGGTLQPSPAPRFDGHRADLNPLPARDQHRTEILTDLRQRGLLP
ncbi:CaiB/BaiF CoA-transferase family protein [Frigidibacter sp.]|uniref:CaiB/BaiF CoA transferase family protein n=1 Tax=Frigidibacter sp. TaxID=2586418 RepID=UPI002736B398|nr:CaiB/BaiF CoA-transferase family protein [Frigidibacter sp.]MDP3340744.1 CaiB/BaiF CoA-transferase family protein [Frigidibacter sp.]